ncbi:unnamed protein product [Pleuronectes platessa]|uniref:Uncharacterized protein n=1 Tax=Pleuronectes platessa TaxID=8262 RepID=A0A9N7ZBT8_PLEPL|nr:unnamed protein product [Pleuronectes platessa]
MDVASCDCRQNNNLTKRGGLCKAGWLVKKKPGGRKEFVGAGREKPEVGLTGGIGRGVLGGAGVGVGLKEFSQKLFRIRTAVWTKPSCALTLEVEVERSDMANRCKHLTYGGGGMGQRQEGSLYKTAAT